MDDQSFRLGDHGRYTAYLSMIYSAIKDNWNRVRLMHDVAHGIYASTLQGDYRERLISGGEFFPFDPSLWESMQSESHIVGMIKSWAVITLECLANHQIAEMAGNTLLATFAIEYAPQITDRLKICKSAQSELAKKMLILSGRLKRKPNDELAKIVEIADSIAEIRNSIVHDKPYRLVYEFDEDVDVTHYKSRGTTESTTHRFCSLPAFYDQCDLLKNFIVEQHPSIVDSFDFQFGSLNVSAKPLSESSAV
jgi:hypothetical protein